MRTKKSRIRQRRKTSKKGGNNLSYRDIQQKIKKIIDEENEVENIKNKLTNLVLEINPEPKSRKINPGAFNEGTAATAPPIAEMYNLIKKKQ